MIYALETRQLGKRFGRVWGLQQATLCIPPGHVVGLIGPNGAGKTTLLHLVVGLLAPSTGDVRVFGYSPTRNPLETLSRVGFVAQDHPLYRSCSTAELLKLGGKLNPRWDDALARGRLKQLSIPLDQPIGRLSGGQQAQVALTLALAKRPDLLVLDEPTASLDPLARREFMQSLMDAVAAGGLTVLLSSHALPDLDRICDYLVLLTSSCVALAESLDTILASHKRLLSQRSSPEILNALARAHTILQVQRAERQIEVIARLQGPVPDPLWEVYDATLEDIALAYLRQAGPLPSRTSTRLEAATGGGEAGESKDRGGTRA
jgi:ABC-2 type transport system ATP-binding protein